MVIGRNDPCPCGSGKKYKKCCQGKDRITKRLDDEKQEGETAIGADVSLYGVWREWRKARSVSNFGLLYDLLEPSGGLRSRVGARAEFVAACADGRAEIPSGEVATFKHLCLYDGTRARLLQTVGELDPGSATFTCECIDLGKSDAGWRIVELAVRKLAKSEAPEISLALFESAPR